MGANDFALGLDRDDDIDSFAVLTADEVAVALAFDVVDQVEDPDFPGEGFVAAEGERVADAVASDGLDFPVSHDSTKILQRADLSVFPLDEHGHEDVDVVVASDDAEDAGVAGAAGFHGDFGGDGAAGDLEHVLEVADVVGDARVLTLDHGVDAAAVVAEFLGAGGERDALVGVVAAEDEADDAAGLAGEDGGRAHAALEHGAGQDGAGSGTRRG